MLSNKKNAGNNIILVILFFLLFFLGNQVNASSLDCDGESCGSNFGECLTGFTRGSCPGSVVPACFKYVKDCGGWSCVAAGYDCIIPSPTPTPTPTPTSGSGRLKCINRTCTFDPNDSGLDQCSPAGSSCGGSSTPTPPPGCIPNGQACNQNPGSCCSNYCPVIVGAPDICQPAPTPTPPPITPTPTPTSTPTPAPTPPPFPSSAPGPVPCDPNIIFPGHLIICDFFPSIVSPGDIVQITGNELTSSIQLISTSDGNIITVVGSLNSTRTTADFTVPIGTPDADYSIKVSGNIIQLNGSTNYQEATIAKLLRVSAPTSGNPSPGSQSIPLPSAQSFETLISSAFNYAVMFVGIAVFIMILYAGFLWLTSAANPGNIARAKSMILNAILGGILLLSAYVILYTINPELVGGGFSLTGIPAPSSTSTSSTQNMVAFDELGSASAITEGCIISTERNNFTAIKCPITASLPSSLVINPIIESFDSQANNQVGATTLQSSGNNGSGVIIAVLDTGYNYTHPELSSSYLGGWDFINNDNDPMDDDTRREPAHGSHVAGIITGDGIDPQALGVAPQAGIKVGKILASNGYGNWDALIKAIYWMIDGPDEIHGTSDDPGTDIINLSVGAAGICGSSTYTDLINRTTDAIRYARDNGVLVVIASGNTGSAVAFPGCIDESFTVGAVDNSDRIAYFSNRGSSVDLVAPGVRIYSALLGNNYGYKQGTSQAAPVVSGVAALLKSVNPSYTVAQLEGALINTACDLGATGKDTVYGWGRVSAVSGACTPSPSQPSSIRGTISTNPTSCIKGAVAGNPNCNVVINYSITGASATQLTVRKDNAFYQNIQCNASPCSGQFNDSNPSGGTHRYSIHLPNGNQIVAGNAYIYVSGTITSNFTSCAKFNSPTNPNCNLTLGINVSGINTGSLIVTRDGVNWRTIQCTVNPCTSTLIELNPALGIHTYALLDGTGNNRLSRATVRITQSSNPTSPPPTGQQSITICSDINYGGICETMVAADPDFRDNLIGNDTASSIILNTSDIRLCADINYGGLCENFRASDPDLRDNPIGNDAASSIMSF